MELGADEEEASGAVLGAENSPVRIMLCRDLLMSLRDISAWHSRMYVITLPVGRV
jgi:hypothetical protein